MFESLIKVKIDIKRRLHRVDKYIVFFRIFYVFNFSDAGEEHGGGYSGYGDWLETTPPSYSSTKPSYSSKKPSYSSSKPSYSPKKPSYSNRKPSYSTRRPSKRPKNNTNRPVSSSKRPITTHSGGSRRPAGYKPSYKPRYTDHFLAKEFFYYFLMNV